MKQIAIKKCLFLLFLFVFITQKGYTQFKTPLFEMPIYFEDAKGHKDSIIIGFDKNSDKEIIDSLFGEDKFLDSINKCNF